MNTDLEKGEYVREMFSRISKRYDLMNRIMTGGRDIQWRREVIQIARSKQPNSVLDLGAGTGDLALEALKQMPNTDVIAGDFTISMMLEGKNSSKKQQINWIGCDALNLPFTNEQFDAVVSGFLLRNVADVMVSLREQYRVLSPGGVIVLLDTTKPLDGPLLPLVNYYLTKVIPFIGGIVTHENDAYHYLPSSTTSFFSAEQIASYLIETGFEKVGFTRKMFSTIAIHWGIKPFIKTVVQ